MLVYEEVVIYFDMRICYDSDSFLLLFYLVEEFMQTLKIGIIKLKIASAIRVLNVKPQVVHRHLELIEFIQQANQVVSADWFPFGIVITKRVIRR